MSVTPLAALTEDARTRSPRVRFGIALLALTVAAAVVAIAHFAGGFDTPVQLNWLQLAAGALLLLSAGAAGAVLLLRRQSHPPAVQQRTPIDPTNRLRTTEARLYEVLTRHQTYWEHAPECLFAVRVTESGEFIYEGVNPANERLTGFRNSEVSGKTPRECLPPAIADAALARYHACVESGRTLYQEEVLDFPLGRRRMHVTLTPVRDPRTSRISLIIGNARDITAARLVTEQLEAAQDALTTTNRRLHSVLDSISDSYFTLDDNLVITSMNEAALRWFSTSREQAVGRSCLEIMRQFPLADPVNRKAIAEGRSVHTEFVSSFQRRWIEVHLYPSADGISCFFRDISERKLAEQTIASTKGLLASSLDAMSAHVAILDETGTIVLANSSWRDFLREQKPAVSNDGIGADYLALNLLTPAERGESARFRAGLKAVLTGTSSEFRFTCRTRLGGQDRWYHINAARFHTGGWSRIVVAHEDVSEVWIAQKAIEDLSQRLVTLQEDERQRIAMELHDSTSQHLTAMALNLMAMRQKSEPRDSMLTLFDEVDKSLEEAMKEIRVFSYLLYPPYLADDGLHTTLLRFVEGFARRTNLKMQIKVAGEVDDLPVVVQRAVLRVVQEALGNVHRHAAATEIVVELAFKRGQLVIYVADDGRGIAETENVLTPRLQESGVGVPGMQARVNQFGGDLRIRSGSKGTRVFARIPLSATRERWQPGRRREARPVAATAKRLSEMPADGRSAEH